MDFALTKQQIKLKDAVKKFCEIEFNSDYSLQLNKTETFPMDLYKKATKQGFSRLVIPETYGGRGQGYLAACLAMEEMCRNDSSLGLACMIGTFGSELILFFGTEEQKFQYLKPLCRGEKISAAAFTEPFSGTDITNVDTVAVNQGNDWIINGTKTLITNAPIADFFIVLCQTATNNSPRKSQSLLIVNRETEGLVIRKLLGKMGIRCVTTGEVVFKDVKVPNNNLIGEKNNGYRQSMDFFTVSRILIAAQAVGTAQGAFEIALKYAKKRESSGQPIIKFQQIGAKLAQVASEIEAARLLTYKAALSIDKNKLDSMLTSMAKLIASKAAVRATDSAIQTLGGYGYLEGYKVERAYRDAKVTEIYEGTSEIQRLAILKQLIKKY